MVSCRELAKRYLYYQTPKIVKIQSFFVGIMSRTLQLIILIYIFGYAIIYKRGYQEVSDVSSSVTIKVKGVVFTNFSSDELNPNLTNPEWYNRVWDVADYVIPVSENNAVFIATNMIITANQTLGTCAEDPKAKDSSCDPNNNTCTPGKSLRNGVATGKCIIASNSSNYSCEINAWCPVENSVFPLKGEKHFLQGAENFTVMIKNFVEFPKFPKSKRRNIKDKLGEHYLSNCEYHSETDKDCPIFRLGNIVERSGHENFNNIAFQGGVIALVIRWDCDLDGKSECYPTYEFSRLDNPLSQLAPGWNFRHGIYYSERRRSLYKIYGIRLAITVIGKAGKFSLVFLLINLGAGLGLLVMERVVCDFVVLYLIKKKDFYASKKYEEVYSSEALPTVQMSRETQVSKERRVSKDHESASTASEH